MKLPEYEAVEGVPSGLIACRINGEQAHIAGISPRCVILRTPDAIAPGAALVLYFLRIPRGGYDAYTIKNYQAGEARREQGAVLTRLSFDDSACAAAIRGSLDNYARYVEIRSEAGASAYGQAVTGYPLDADESFHESLEQQRRAWFESFPPLPLPEKGVELAVELNCPELWRLYLSTPAGEFLHAYARCRKLPEDYFSGHKLGRLYVGNPYCRHLIPDLPTLRRIAEKAAREDMHLTLVTAELRAGGEAQADALFSFAAGCGAELAVNDWGMLERAQARKGGLRILLGTQLNRRRKDPRMAYKAGLNESLLAENSLNSAPWREYLRGMGVSRFEYESCGLPATPPGGACSLHLPFYQTNTSLWCPLRAVCTRGGRGAQSHAESCTLWCENNVFLYPAHLKLIGRWNSLLALDDARDAGILQKFDRWVLNF